MLGKFPRATSPIDLVGGRCSRPKVECAIRSVRSVEQGLTLAWLDRNLGEHNSNAEREPNARRLSWAAAAGPIELPFAPNSDANPCDRSRGNIFDRARRLTGSRRRRSPDRA